jgi:hypothetical protein
MGIVIHIVQKFTSNDDTVYCSAPYKIMDFCVSIRVLNVFGARLFLIRTAILLRPIQKRRLMVQY